MSAGLKDNLLEFKLSFENPLYVSIGTDKDKLITTIVDASFFSSTESGLPIENGQTITSVIPKMLPGDQYGTTLKVVE